MMEGQHKPWDEEAVTAILNDWLPQISPQHLRKVGWLEVNRRRHVLAMAARTFANTHYASKEDADAREGVMIGFVLGQLAELHITDIAELYAHLMPTAELSSGATTDPHPQSGTHVIEHTVTQETE